MVLYLPSDTAIGLSSDVGGLGELLAKVVSRQFLEEEVVQTLLSYQTLNSYDAWLDALDQVEGGGGDGKAVLQLCLHLHAGEVQVEWDAPLHRHTWVGLPKVPLVKKVFSVIRPPPYSTNQRLNESGVKKSLSRALTGEGRRKKIEVQSLTSAYVFGDSILVGNWTTLAVAGTRTIPPSRNRIILPIGWPSPFPNNRLCMLQCPQTDIFIM